MNSFSQRRQQASLKDCSFLGPALPELLAASLFLNLLGLALPLALLQVYDRIIPQAATGTLELLFFGVMVAILLETILRIARSDLAAWLGARFEHVAGCAAMTRLAAAVIADVEREGSGVHLERWNALTTVKESYSGQNLLLLLDLPFAALYLGMIWLIAGPLVLVPGGVLLLFVLAAWLSGQALRKSLEGRGRADERRFNFIIEVLTGTHTVKSMAMENLMQRRHERLQESCAEWDLRIAKHNATAQTLTAFFSQLATISVVAMGALSIMEGSMTTGALAACVMLTSRSLQPMAKAMGIWSRYQAVRLARRRLGELFTLPAETFSGQVRPALIRGELELRALSFRYAPELSPCIDDVSIRIAAGECVAISGANSAGKSTLLSLMLGALPPSAGKVLLDGVALTDLDADCRKTAIAYIPQHGVLFRGTLLENITLFRPELVDAAIAVAERLGLDQVVRTMPLGYNTRVAGGAGDSLPRGIKQRIAVARALVARPKVVLFDDANTGVDSSGDTHLRTCLEELKDKCTLVLVTHRPSLLRLAKRVFDLREGQLHQRSKESAPAAHGEQPVLVIETE